MTIQEIKDIAKPIIVSGLKGDAEHDAIRTQMVIAGVPFGKAMSIFTTIAIEEGLMVDPTVMTAAIKEQVKTFTWDECKTWADVMLNVNDILTEVKGSVLMRVLQVVRSYCKEQKIDLPKEIKTAGERSLGGKAAVIVCGVFKKNPEATKQDLYKALAGSIDSDKVIVNAVKLWYCVAASLATGKDIQEIHKNTAEEKYGADVVDPEPEVAEAA